MGSHALLDISHPQTLFHDDKDLAVMEIIFHFQEQGIMSRWVMLQWTYISLIGLSLFSICK